MPAQSLGRHLRRIHSGYQRCDPTRSGQLASEEPPALVEHRFDGRFTTVRLVRVSLGLKTATQSTVSTSLKSCHRDGWSASVSMRRSTPSAVSCLAKAGFRTKSGIVRVALECHALDSLTAIDAAPDHTALRKHRHGDLPRRIGDGHRARHDLRSDVPGRGNCEGSSLRMTITVGQRSAANARLVAGPDASRPRQCEFLQGGDERTRSAQSSRMVCPKPA
jgi:hypothetical protein